MRKRKEKKFTDKRTTDLLQLLDVIYFVSGTQDVDRERFCQFCTGSIQGYRHGERMNLRQPDEKSPCYRGTMSWMDGHYIAAYLHLHSHPNQSFSWLSHYHGKREQVWCRIFSIIYKHFHLFKGAKAQQKRDRNSKGQAGSSAKSQLKSNEAAKK